jgi:acyl carrier protein phosphodiesterase
LNYLVHLFLSDPDPLCRLGNLMGDFVKGPLTDQWPPAVRRGLRQHRQVDSFAQLCPAFRASKRRLDPVFGHYRGILVDVFYDHFLARSWERHSAQPLPAFAAEIYRTLETQFQLLPAGLQAVAPRMIAHNWLVSYREPAAIGRALERMALRLRRANPLAQGLPELLRHYDELAGDCDVFLAAAQAHLAQNQFKDSTPSG